MYKIFLSYNNNEEILELPILPEKLNINRFGQNVGMNVLNIGEVTQQKLPKAFTISIESEFPSVEYASSRKNTGNFSDYTNPYDCVNTILKWQELLQPIRFVWVGGSVEINSPVSIEDFSYSEQGGDVGTISYLLNLKSYTFYGQEKLSINGNRKLPLSNSREDMRQVPKLYTTQFGDTIVSISRKVFGNDTQVSNLIKLNGFTSADIADGIPAGAQIRTY